MLALGVVALTAVIVAILWPSPTDARWDGCWINQVVERSDDGTVLVRFQGYGSPGDDEAFIRSEKCPELGIRVTFLRQSDAKRFRALPALASSPAAYTGRAWLRDLRANRAAYAGCTARADVLRLESIRYATDADSTRYYQRVLHAQATANQQLTPKQWAQMMRDFSAHGAATEFCMS